MAPETISYSAFREALAQGRVVSCEVGPEQIRGQLRVEGEAEPIAFRTARVDDPELVADLRSAGVEPWLESPTSSFEALAQAIADSPRD